MRPTVPDLLAGVAAALEAEVVTALDPAAAGDRARAAVARDQLVAAVALLRRVALVIPHLQVNLLADCDDLATALVSIRDGLTAAERQRADEAIDSLTALDPRQTTLDEIDAVHQRLLDVADLLVVAYAGAGTPAGATIVDALRPALERMVEP